MSSKASYDNYFKRNCFLFEKKELEPEPTNNFGSGRGSIVIKPRLMVGFELMTPISQVVPTPPLPSRNNKIKEK